MGKLVAAYESYLMNIRHASDNTVASYLRDVRQFTTYLEQTDGPALEACTQETVCAYVRHLTSIGKSPATDRKSTRLNSSHSGESRMPSSA